MNMKSLLCFFGFHDWRYFGEGQGRQCQREDCFEWQFRHHDGYPRGRWIRDSLGSGVKRDGWKQWDDNRGPNYDYDAKGGTERKGKTVPKGD